MQKKMTTHLSFSNTKASNEIQKKLLPLEEEHHTAKIREISIQIYTKFVAMELGHDVTFDEFLCCHIRKIILKNYYCYSNLFKN
jgi:hypothetical protein